MRQMRGSVCSWEFPKSLRSETRWRMYVRSRPTVCLGQRWRAATFVRWFNPLTAHTSRYVLTEPGRQDQYVAPCCRSLRYSAWGSHTAPTVSPLIIFLTNGTECFSEAITVPLWSSPEYK